MTDNKDLIVCNGCFYKTKSNPCMVLTEIGRQQSVKNGACMMRVDGSLPNKASCKKNGKYEK